MHYERIRHAHTQGKKLGNGRCGVALITSNRKRVSTAVPHPREGKCLSTLVRMTCCCMAVQLLDLLVIAINTCRPSHGQASAPEGRGLLLAKLDTPRPEQTGLSVVRQPLRSGPE